MATIKEVAQMLNGREIGDEIDVIERCYAKEDGIVIVFGASDDLLEFRGAIDDEAGCWEGSTIYFNRSGELRSECDCDDCPYFEKTKLNASKIKAIWGAEGYSWTYETDIPHETFDIFEDGDTYCRGIVFLLADVVE